ncbi:hypothetical protein Efla_006493 [Eimeria flavescens]
MRRTVHAAAAAAAAATLDMEAVQRSLAAAAWRQGDLGAHLQGVIEEEDEEGGSSGSSLSQQQQQQQQQHPWGAPPPGPGPLARRSCLVKAVFGSYSHKGVSHDNEDRVSVSVWGLGSSSPAAAAAGGKEHNRHSSSPDSCSSLFGFAATPRDGAEKSILELAAGGRGLGYEWHVADSPTAAAAAAAAATAAATAATAAECVSYYGVRCKVPPRVAAGVRIAVQGRFLSDFAAMQDAAATAAAAAAAAAAAPAAATAAAVDAAVEHLVGGPPALAWSSAAAQQQQQEQQQQQQQQRAKCGPLSVLRRRKQRLLEVEGSTVSACWEPSPPLTAGAGAGAGGFDCHSPPSGLEGGPSVLCSFKPLEAAKKDGSQPCALFLVCDGHDTHEAAAFISKALPLLSYRRLPQQLPLMHADQLHAAGKTLFADLDALMRRRCAELAKQNAEGATTGSCLIAAVLQQQHEQQQQQQNEQQQQQHQQEEEVSAAGSIGLWDYKEYAFRPLSGGQSSPGAVGTLSDLLLQQQPQCSDWASLSRSISSNSLSGKPSSSSSSSSSRSSSSSISSSNIHLSRSDPTLQRQQQRKSSSSSSICRDKSFFLPDSADCAMRQLLQVPSSPCVLQHQQQQQQQQHSVASVNLPLPLEARFVAAAAAAPRGCEGVLAGISSGSSISSSSSSRVSLTLTPSGSRMHHCDSNSSVAASSSNNSGDSSIRFQWLSRQLRCGCPSEEKRIRALGVRIINKKMGGIIEPTRSIGDFDVKDRLPPRALSLEPEIGVYSLSSLFAAPPAAAAAAAAAAPAAAAALNCGLLLLATDGVWDFVDSSDVLKCVRKTKLLWKALEAAAKKTVDLQLQQQQQQLQQHAVAAHPIRRKAASASDLSSLLRSSLGGGSSSSTNKQQQQQQQGSAMPSGLKRISSWRRLLPSQGLAASLPSNSSSNSISSNFAAASAATAAPASSPCPSPHQKPQQQPQQQEVFSSLGGLQQTNGQASSSNAAAAPAGGSYGAQRQASHGGAPGPFESVSPQLLSELCQRIVKKALKNGSTDDCTCLAAFLYPVHPAAAAAGGGGGEEGGLSSLRLSSARASAESTEGGWSSLV